MDLIDLQLHAALVDQMRCPECRSELEFVPASAVHADFADDEVARRCTRLGCSFSCVVGDRRCACGEIYAQYESDQRHATCPTCRVFPEECPACGDRPFTTFMRGVVRRQSRAWYAPWNRRPPWAIICRSCKEIVGYEWRQVADGSGQAHRFLAPDEDTRPFNVAKLRQEMATDGGRDGKDGGRGGKPI